MTVHPMPSAEARDAVRRLRALEEDVFPDALLLWVGATTLALAVTLTLAVNLEVTGDIDRWLFDLVHEGTGWTPATAPWWWNEAVRDITALGGTVVLTGAVASACIYLAAGGRYRLCALLLLSALAATLFSSGAKLIFLRARPSGVEAMVTTVSASFPSGHALLSAAILLVIGGLVAFASTTPAQRRTIMGTTMLLTISVGLSRIWLGVHWPSDVLAGWMFGTAWAALTLWLAKHVDRQGQQPEARQSPPDEDHRIGRGFQS